LNEHECAMLEETPTHIYTLLKIDETNKYLCILINFCFIIRSNHSALSLSRFYLSAAASSQSRDNFRVLSSAYDCPRQNPKSVDFHPLLFPFDLPTKPLFVDTVRLVCVSRERNYLDAGARSMNRDFVERADVENANQSSRYKKILRHYRRVRKTYTRNTKSIIINVKEGIQSMLRHVIRILSQTKLYDFYVYVAVVVANCTLIGRLVENRSYIERIPLLGNRNHC